MAKISTKIKKNKPSPQEVPQVDLNTAPVTEAPQAPVQNHQEQKEQPAHNASPEIKVESNVVKETPASSEANSSTEQAPEASNPAHTEGKDTPPTNDSNPAGKTPSAESNPPAASNLPKVTHGIETGFTEKQEKACLTKLSIFKQNIMNELADNSCLPVYYNACKPDAKGDLKIKSVKTVNYKLLGAQNEENFCKMVESTAITKGLVKEEPVSQPEQASANEFGIIEPTETTKYDDNLCFMRFATLASEHWVKDEDEFATADLALHYYNHEMPENFKVLPQCSDFYKKLCANPENYQNFSDQYKKPLEDIIEDCQGINSFLSHYFYA